MELPDAASSSECSLDGASESLSVPALPLVTPFSSLLSKKNLTIW
jgi:hypothetical protein